MSIKGTTGRELRNLSFIIVITIIFSLLSLSIDFVDKFREYVPFYEIVPISDLLVNSFFLYLIVILGITYNRWKKAAGKQKELEKKKVGVTICEDIWNVGDFEGVPLYEIDPVNELQGNGIDLLINISASPYTVNKGPLRLKMLKTERMRF